MARDWIILPSSPAPGVSRSLSGAAKVRMLADGSRTAREIAEMTGCHLNYIYVLARTEGLTLKRGQRGVQPGSKLGSEPLVARNSEIVRRVIEGEETLEAVAKDYKLTRERVRQIVWRATRISLIGRKNKMAAKAKLATEKRAAKAAQEKEWGEKMLALVSLGVSIRAAAKRAGVTKQSMADKLSRRYGLGKLTHHGRWRKKR
jgi:hypothetical protein